MKMTDRLLDNVPLPSLLSRLLWGCSKEPRGDRGGPWSYAPTDRLLDRDVLSLQPDAKVKAGDSGEMLWLGFYEVLSVGSQCV